MVKNSGDTLISSRSNAKIKLIQGLDLRKNRSKERKYVIEGIRIVEDALKYLDDSRFDFAVYSPKLLSLDGGSELVASLRSRRIHLYESSDEILSGISNTSTTQGIICVMKMDEISNDKLRAEFMSDAKLALVLDNVQDPGNLGTMVRTADAAGFKYVLCTKGTVDIYNPKVLRSTMGSMFNTRIIYLEAEDAMSLLSESGFSIYGAALEGAVDYGEPSYDSKVAIVIGNEGNGISDFILAKCDVKIKIPIYGKAESLNASVAAGILLYKVAEKRR